MLGISIGTVESRLFRARARFKEKLLQKHPEFGAEL
jgi:DNA-directed RNA polymerase specialized sigma24 family protein